MTFGVVLFTLLVPGLTMEPLVRFLGMAPKREKLDLYLEYKSLLSAYRAELQGIALLDKEGRMSESAQNEWKTHLQEQILELGRKMESLQLTDSSLNEMQDKQAKVHLLESRKDFLAGLVKKGALREDTAHHLYVNIDSELDQITDAEPSYSIAEVEQDAKKPEVESL